MYTQMLEGSKWKQIPYRKETGVLQPVFLQQSSHRWLHRNSLPFLSSECDELIEIPPQVGSASLYHAGEVCAEPLKLINMIQSGPEEPARCLSFISCEQSQTNTAVLLLELVQSVLAMLGLSYVTCVICYAVQLRLERNKSIPRKKPLLSLLWHIFTPADSQSDHVWKSLMGGKRSHYPA